LTLYLTNSTLNVTT